MMYPLATNGENKLTGKTSRLQFETVNKLIPTPTTTIPDNGSSNTVMSYAVRSATRATAELLVIDTLALETLVL